MGTHIFVLIFTPKLGEDESNLTSIFSKGLNPPTRNRFHGSFPTSSTLNHATNKESPPRKKFNLHILLFWNWRTPQKSQLSSTKFSPRGGSLAWHLGCQAWIGFCSRGAFANGGANGGYKNSLKTYVFLVWWSIGWKFGWLYHIIF